MRTCGWLLSYCIRTAELIRKGEHFVTFSSFFNQKPEVSVNHSHMEIVLRLPFLANEASKPTRVIVLAYSWISQSNTVLNGPTKRLTLTCKRSISRLFVPLTEKTFVWTPRPVWNIGKIAACFPSCKAICLKNLTAKQRSSTSSHSFTFFSIADLLSLTEGKSLFLFSVCPRWITVTKQNRPS